MLIWHYISTNILNEFLKDGAKLYATHIGFLNDTHEGIISDSLLESYIYHILSYLENVKTSEIEVHNIIKTGSFFSRFITSFSENNDDLSKWRSYAPQGGYAIGFDYEKLKSSIISNKIVNIIFKKCEYIELNEEQQYLERIKQLCDKIKS